jgi:hypothetical protein
LLVGLVGHATTIFAETEKNTRTVKIDRCFSQAAYFVTCIARASSTQTVFHHLEHFILAGRSQSVSLGLRENDYNIMKGTV